MKRTAIEDEANRLSERKARGRASLANRYAEDPPWYARYAPESLWKRFKLLNRMLSDYFSGRYKRIPWRTIAMATGAVGYVIMPFDAILDFLGPLGFTDDVAVVAMVIKAIGDDLDRYARDLGLNLSEHGL